MQYILFGLLALATVLLVTRGFVVASPAALARTIRTAGAVTAFGVGLTLLIRGSPSLAFWVSAAGAWLLIGRPAWRGGKWSGGGEAPRQTSRVVSEHLDIELEHDTGAIRGTVLKGFFAGRDLETLRPVELAHLWVDCRFADPQSAQILEAYLDRIHPTWRDDMQRTGGATGDGQAPPATGNGMSREEALDILGLKPGASEDEIRRAHRELMLRVHPDRGGSHILAAKVNEAKDVLLG